MRATIRNMDLTNATTEGETVIPSTAEQPQADHNPVTGIGPISHTYNTAEEEALESEIQELEALDDEKISKNLLIYSWVRQQLERVKASQAEADARQKELRVAAEAVIKELNPEQSQAIVAWIGARDRAQQFQGALNMLGRIMTPIHNLNAGTLSAQIIVAKLRRENRRILEIAAVNGVKLPRSITRKRR